MGLNKAVFLDRDGTIARDVHYCSRPEDFELLPTVPEAVKLLNDNGFKVVVITNQSGIARGYFTEAVLTDIHQKMVSDLSHYDARVNAIYYCPHHPDDKCVCRKPGTALYYKAASEHGIDINQSYVVGDSQMDIDAGRALGCKTILITTGPQKGNDVVDPPDFMADSLLEAVRWILSKKVLNTIIIPAYREQEGIPVVLSKVFQTIDDTYEVIVVDDGSDDGTAQVASRFPCRVIRHEVNKGKGEAIITGANNALSDNLIYIDADDSYPAAAIPQIAKALQQYAIVIGSRKYGQGNIPRFNRLGNFFFRNMIRMLYGFKPYDPLTGLWGIKRQQIFRCKPTVRFAPDAEIFMKASRLKLKMLDIPIVYAPRVGKTKLPPIKAGFEHLRLIFSLLFWKQETLNEQGQYCQSCLK